MAGNDVTITLTARDQASQTFKTVSRNAQDMGKDVEQAGKQASTMGDSFNKAGARIGAALASATGMLSDFGQAAAESEASQARLETAIDNTGHSALEYEDALNAAGDAAVQLGFDDEDAADSIAMLTTATGDASQAISDLSIAEDIARARKISLEAATKLVIAAEQGRVGALQRLGIAVDQNATREERLDALRAQFAGNAEAYAQTTAGALDRVKVELGNVEESIGGVVNGFTPLIALLPGLQAGWVGISTVIGALIPEIEGATVAATALDLALGPVGIAAALLAAAAAAVYFSGILKDDVTPGAEEAAQATDAATDALTRYQQAGSTQAILQKELNESIGYIITATTDEAAAVEDATSKKKDAEYWLGQIAQGYNLSGKSAEYWQQQLDDANAVLDDSRASSADYSITLSDLAAAQSAANQIIADTGPAADETRDKLQRLYDEQQSGKLGWAEYIRQVIALGNELPGLNQQEIETAANVQKTTDAINGGSEAGKEHINVLTGYKQSIAALGDQYLTLDGQIDDTIAKQTEWQDNLTGAGKSQQVLGAQIQAPDLDSLNSANTALAENARLSNDAAAAAAAHEAKLKEQQGAYYGLRDGIISANDAQGVFRETQRGLIEDQEPFNQQISTYNSQLNAITDAREVLQQRQEDGIALTKEETQFLNDSTDAEARLTGGVEDATVARGELALQYAENMKLGDQMNQSLADNAGNTETLNTTIRDLIAALQGIPGYVSTYIDANTQDAEIKLGNYVAQLDNVNGKTVYTHVYVDAYGPGISFQAPFDKLGGIVPGERQVQRAQHGASLAGMAWVGEGGPELIYAPGARVFPHTASVAKANAAMGGNIHIAQMTVIANDPTEFARRFDQQMASYRYGEMRQ